MSTTHIAGNLSVNHVAQQVTKKVDVMMRALLVGIESAKLKEEAMERMLDDFQGRNQRTKDFTTLKAAIQELDGLCQGKKPNEDIKGILDANPALKARIDNLSAKLGVQPFEPTTAANAGAAPGTSQPQVAEEPLPASVDDKALKEITPYVFKYLTNDKARKALMQEMPLSKDGYMPSSESAYLDGKGGTELIGDVRNFLKSPAGKDLIKYMDKHGDLGAERLRQEMGEAGATPGAAKSATDGVIPKSQIEAAKTRLTGETDGLSSEQQIETMKLNHLNGQRTAAFEFCMTCIRTHSELARMVSSSR